MGLELNASSRRSATRHPEFLRELGEVVEARSLHAVEGFHGVGACAFPGECVEDVRVVRGHGDLSLSSVGSEVKRWPYAASW
jgi:hypothetical protein